LNIPKACEFRHLYFLFMPEHAMAEQLFLNDSYIREFDAKVVSCIPHQNEPGKAKLVLDKTAFYATSGGQPCDLGKITGGKSGKTCEVVDVRKENGEIVHTLVGDASDFAAGGEVHGEINWERRHRLMRIHTAGHALSAVMYEKGILITGNQLGLDETRFDFNMEEFDRNLIEQCIAEANAKIAQNKNITISFLPRDEAMKLPGMSKLATALPPAITVLRIVEIEGIDRQADGGTHVKNTSEIGKIELTRAENKGKNNRRIYFAIRP